MLALIAALLKVSLEMEGQNKNSALILLEVGEDYFQVAEACRASGEKLW